MLKALYLRGRIPFALILLVLIPGIALAQVAPADSAVVTGGFGKWILDSLFEAGDISTAPSEPGIIGSVITPFSLACMVVAAFVIILKSVQHILIVAQAKDVESSPIAMTWAPIHLVLAVVLIMPLPSGYSAGQYVGIWVAEQSNFLGNVTASKAKPSEYGVITQMPLPGVRAMTESIIDAHICRTAHNIIAEHVAEQGGARTFVEPRRLMTNEIENIIGLGGTNRKYSENSTVTRAGVIYNRYKEGGFLNNNPAAHYCGGVFVEYSTDTPSKLFGEDVIYSSDDSPISLNRGVNNVNVSDLETCKFGALCVGGKDLTGLDTREGIVREVFTEAHNRASEIFLEEAMNPKASQKKVADALLYDLETYLNGQLDNASLSTFIADQAQEQKQIEIAVTESVKLLSTMQTQVYKGYSSAINQFATERNAAGDNFGDLIDKVGWPILGLYWFQNSTFNSRVLDSVNFSSSSTVFLDDAIRDLGANIDDPQMTTRLASRLDQYKTRLRARLQNTRLDGDPISAGIGGRMSYPGMASQATDPFNASAAMGNAVSAADIKDTFPDFANGLIVQAAKGAITDEDTIMEAIQEYTRSTIFPFLLEPLRGDNLLTGLVNTGHNIIVASEIVFVGKHVVNSVASELEKRGVLDPKDKPAQQRTKDTSSSFFGKVGDTVTGFFVGLVKSPISMARDILNFFFSMWFYVFLLGLFLAFYLPAIIMIQWLIALVTWMIYVLEATIIIPLWGVLFTSHMGEKAFAPQIASQGFIHLLSILIYPSLLVIGFIVGLKVVDVASMFILDFLITGFLSSVDGYLFGIVSLVAGLFIVAVAAYQILLRIFSLMLEFNDRAIAWIGNRQTYGEGNVENQVRGGVTAIIGKVETQGRGVGRAATAAAKGK